MKSTTMFSKSRRVKDNKIIIITCLLKILKRILTEGLMTLIALKIQCDITVCKFDSLCTAVNRVNQLSSTTHSVYRESTCITEHIQYALTCRILLQQRTVITLVNKETSFLSTQPIHIEFQSVLKSHIIIRTAIDKAILHIIHKWQCGFTLIVNIIYTLTHYFNQLLSYFLTT